MIPTIARNLITRRSLHMTSIARTEGAAANSGAFGQKEKAVENQWARTHDAELLKQIKKALETQEQETASLRKKLADLEGKK
ncbi:hypothetical protein BDB01DRAFT_772131 [Pilobolus umbonatus]|nr:hypothetical protein BDB01DRAFT_772131 [Pilobolus umbonatus]